MESEEALERLCDGYPNVMAARICYDIIVRDLNLLEKYREIEEELGIDLITLFKAYSNGFYVRGEKEKQYIDFKNYLNANAFKHKEMFYGHKYCYQYVKLYDYGKEWALTKQELEQ